MPRSSDEGDGSPPEWAGAYQRLEDLQGVSVVDLAPAEVPFIPGRIKLSLPKDAKSRVEQLTSEGLLTAIIGIGSERPVKAFNQVVARFCLRQRPGDEILIEQMRDTGEKIGFKVDTYPIDLSDQEYGNKVIDSHYMDWIGRNAALLSPDQVYDLAHVLICTVGLLMKYSTTKFQTYVAGKLPTIATSKGVPQAQGLVFADETVLALTGALQKGGRLASVIYLMIVTEVGQPKMRGTVDALAGLRLGAYGLTAPWILLQCAGKLQMTPAELLGHLKTKILSQSVSRIIEFLLRLKGTVETTEKYALLMARLLNEAHFSSLGMRGNNNFVYILVAILKELGDETLDQLEGLAVSASFKILAKEFAKQIVILSEGGKEDNPYESSLMRATRQTTVNMTEETNEPFQDQGGSAPSFNYTNMEL